MDKYRRCTVLAVTFLSAVTPVDADLSTGAIIAIVACSTIVVMFGSVAICVCVSKHKAKQTQRRALNQNQNLTTNTGLVLTSNNPDGPAINSSINQPPYSGNGQTMYNPYHYNVTSSTGPQGTQSVFTIPQQGYGQGFGLPPPPGYDNQGYTPGIDLPPEDLPSYEDVLNMGSLTANGKDASYQGDSSGQPDSVGNIREDIPSDVGVKSGVITSNLSQQGTSDDLALPSAPPAS